MRPTLSEWASISEVETTGGCGATGSAHPAVHCTAPFTLKDAGEVRRPHPSPRLEVVRQLILCNKKNVFAQQDDFGHFKLDNMRFGPHSAGRTFKVTTGFACDNPVVR